MAACRFVHFLSSKFSPFILFIPSTYAIILKQLFTSGSVNIGEQKPRRNNGNIVQKGTIQNLQPEKLVFFTGGLGTSMTSTFIVTITTKLVEFCDLVKFRPFKNLSKTLYYFLFFCNSSTKRCSVVLALSMTILSSGNVK